MKGVGALKPSLLLLSFTVTFLTGGMRALVVKVIHVSLCLQFWPYFTRAL